MLSSISLLMFLRKLVVVCLLKMCLKLVVGDILLNFGVRDLVDQIRWCWRMLLVIVVSISISSGMLIVVRMVNLICCISVSSVLLLVLIIQVLVSRFCIGVSSFLLIEFEKVEIMSVLFVIMNQVLIFWFLVMLLCLSVFFNCFCVGFFV